MSALVCLDFSLSFLSSSAAMLLTVNSPTDMLLTDQGCPCGWHRAVRWQTYFCCGLFAMCLLERVRLCLACYLTNRSYGNAPQVYCDELGTLL